MIDVIDWMESRRTSAYGKTGVKQTWRNVARNMAVTARFFSRIRFNIVKVIERNKSQGVKPREEDVPGAILPREYQKNAPRKSCRDGFFTVELKRLERKCL